MAMMAPSVRIAAAMAVVGTLGATLSAWAAEPHGAGSVRGQVDVRRSTSHSHERPQVAALGMLSDHETPDRETCVVYLEAASQLEFAPVAEVRATLDQRGEAFIPYVLPIQVGTIVDFPNHDLIYHNVFSLSKTKRFDLGRYPRGDSRAVRFDKPGVVRVFCEIHSHMSAYILVFPHKFFTSTDPEGRFEIDGVPAGTYSLIVWQDGNVRVRRDVVVKGDGSTVRVDLVVE